MKLPYLVAKYVPDLVRMEPVNVGVVALFADHVSAKFIGEGDASTALDRRRVRNKVRHTGTYKQWVGYWRYVMTHSRSAEDAARELMACSRGNYLIAEGGSLAVPHQVDDQEMLELLDYLFHMVVTEFPSSAEDEATLGERCEEIVREYRLSSNPHFQRAPLISCRVSENFSEFVQPTFAVVNGSRNYFQKVSLNPRRTEMTQKDVHNAAWIFSKIEATYPGSRTKALVRLADGAGTEEYVRVLRAVSTDIVNVDDDQAVQRAFSEFVS